jgi:hypothetical protein
MRDDTPLLTSEEQFRLDVMKAFAELEVKIETIMRSVKEGKVVPSARLKELSSISHENLGKFMDHYGRKLGRL